MMVAEIRIERIGDAVDTLAQSEFTFGGARLSVRYWRIDPIRGRRRTLRLWGIDTSVNVYVSDMSLNMFTCHRACNYSEEKKEIRGKPRTRLLIPEGAHWSSTTPVHGMSSSESQFSIFARRGAYIPPWLMEVSILST